jgi:hypothetical protein
VAEKKAALDVVKRRLDNVGLGDFCLELHSHKTQKAQFHKDLEKRIRTPYRNPQTLDRELKDLRRDVERIKSYTQLVAQLAGAEDEAIYEMFRKTEHWRTDAPHVDSNIFVEKPLKLKREDLDKRILILEETSGIREELPDEVLEVWKGLRLTNIIFDYHNELKKPLEFLKQHIDEFSNVLHGKDIENIKNFLNIKQLRLIINSNYDDLHHIPMKFNVRLAEKFLDELNVSVFRELTKLIEEYKILFDDAKKISLNIETLQKGEAGILIEAITNIEKIGYGTKTPYELSSIITEIESICLGIVKIEEYAIEIADCLTEKPCNIKVTPDVNSGHEVFSCRYIPFIELPLVLSGR